jgi:CBS domain containing-hemolysin-like protein
MTPVDRVPWVDRATPLPQVLDRLAEENAERLLVADRDAVIGIITPRDVARRLERAEELDIGLGDEELSAPAAS